MLKLTLVDEKIKKLDPIMQYNIPLFKVTTELKVNCNPIPSPFSHMSNLGCVERVIGRL